MTDPVTEPPPGTAAEPRAVDMDTARSLVYATMYARSLDENVRLVRAALAAGKPAQARAVASQIRHAATEIIAATSTATDAEMFERGQRAEAARAAGNEREWEIASWHGEIAALVERLDRT